MKWYSPVLPSLPHYTVLDAVVLHILSSRKSCGLCLLNIYIASLLFISWYKLPSLRAWLIIITPSLFPYFLSWFSRVFEHSSQSFQIKILVSSLQCLLAHSRVKASFIIMVCRVLRDLKIPAFQGECLASQLRCPQLIMGYLGLKPGSGS